MALSRRSGRSRFTLVLLVLSSITVLTLDFRGAGFVDNLRGAASNVFSPVRDAAEDVFEPVGDTWNGVFNYGDLESDNERLRARIEDLEGDVVRNADARRQLEELAALNDLPLTSQIPNLTARVVSGPLSNFDHTIEIDRGRGDDIKTGMPVVTGGGLVGRVVQVTSARSVVQLITDPGFEVGVRHVATGEVGIARGNGEGEPLTVADIAPGVPMAEGDALTTSGIDRSIFPPDIPVGQVEAVAEGDDQLSQELEIVPLAGLGQLSYITVLLWEPAP